MEEIVDYAFIALWVIIVLDGQMVTETGDGHT
jgi:hypothetical protein